MLLDSGGRSGLGESFDIDGSVYRLDAGQGEAMPLAPCQEIVYSLGVGPSRVAIADGGGEEFDEPPDCVVALICDDRGQKRPAYGAY